jgi:3-hydroxybutyryl-CoA dehydratase
MSGVRSLERMFAISQEQVARYADVADDHNPLHLDAEFARERGFAAPIAHGLLTLGLVSAAIGDWLGPVWNESGQLDARFSAPVVVGSELALTVDEEAVADGRRAFRVEARVGDTVVIKGAASVEAAR